MLFSAQLRSRMKNNGLKIRVRHFKGEETVDMFDFVS